MDNGQKTLGDYVTKLLQEKNYTSTDSEIVAELKLDLENRLNEYLIAKTIERLDDTSADEFVELMKTNPDQLKIQEFIKSKIENPPEFISEVLIDFRRKFLGLD